MVDPSGAALDVTLVRGDGVKQSFAMQDGRVLTLGSKASNDIVVPSGGVSGKHAEMFLLSQTDGSRQLVVRDTSKNGTGIRAKVPKKGLHCLTWQKLANGASAVLGHSHQLKVPLKSRKGSLQAAEAPRTITVFINGGDSPAAAAAEDRERAKREKKEKKARAALLAGVVPATPVHTWQVTGTPAVYIRSTKEPGSQALGTKNTGAIVLGRREENWVSLTSEAGFMMIQHVQRGVLLKDLGPAKDKRKAETSGGLRLSAENVKAASEAATAEEKRSRQLRKNKSLAEKVASSVPRDISVSPISEPGVGQKKRKLPPQRAPVESSDEEEDAAPVKLKKRKRKDAIAKEPSKSARKGGAALRTVVATSPSPTRRKTKSKR
eukprot:TRINITY_DN40852_c0_g1_i1.p1 TRINITY_DN40852_c0_g1~~TRINITY_DN40852_c0_g1_i1.p1  ORF type:complete len:378 (-),score=101.70 TRINITY_DN40852_c0_g1_i1:147-1280(-)